MRELPSQTLSVIHCKSPEDEARSWRERYVELQQEFQQKQKEWAAEDRETSVADALLQKELELKTALFDKAQETIRDLTEKKVCWAAALGMRDWRPGAFRTRLA